MTLTPNMDLSIDNTNQGSNGSATTRQGETRMIYIITINGSWQAIHNGQNLGGRFPTRRRAELESRRKWGNLPFTYQVEA